LPEEAKPAVATLRGTETILVVEDQEGIRELARAVLKGFGYKVLVAANGWEALVNSERHTGPIHLMLTDIMMPGMTGKELVERFKPLRPEMAVVFMSGYAEQPITQPGAVDAKASFISKPFLPDALAMKVREVLGPPRSAGKVLAIAAEEGIRSFLRVVLVSVGYDVVEVPGGEEALRELDEDGVDLILVDLETGAQADLEKVRTLRQRHPDLKAIVIVGAFGEEFLQAAAQLGVQATLAKPIRADQLLESVRKAVGD
jgi:CheY-like chemotaxis protein